MIFIVICEYNILPNKIEILFKKKIVFSYFHHPPTNLITGER